MATSKKPDTLTAIASVVKTSLPTSKPPETDETNPAPWQSSQPVAAIDEDLDETPYFRLSHDDE